MRMRSMAMLGALVALLALPAVASATMPGENGRIVFSAETSAGIQMFTVRPSGGGLRQITHVAGDALNPDWSPNGHRMVFALGTETSARLAIVRADGTHLTLLPQPAGVFDDQPSYSPNGRWIYFERYTEASNDDAIWRMRIDGTHQERVLGPFPNGFVTPIPTCRRMDEGSASKVGTGRSSVRRRTRSRHVACSPPGSTAAMSSRSVRIAPMRRSRPTGRPADFGSR